MTSINEINTNIEPFIPTQEIADWCINQHVVAYCNTHNMLFIAIAWAWLFLITDVILKETKIWKSYNGQLVLFARIIISIVLLIYLIFYKFNIIPLLNVAV